MENGDEKYERKVRPIWVIPPSKDAKIVQATTRVQDIVQGLEGNGGQILKCERCHTDRMLKSMKVWTGEDLCYHMTCADNHECIEYAYTHRDKRGEPCPVKPHKLSLWSRLVRWSRG